MHDPCEKSTSAQPVAIKSVRAAFGHDRQILGCVHGLMGNCFA